MNKIFCKDILVLVREINQQLAILKDLKLIEKLNKATFNFLQNPFYICIVDEQFDFDEIKEKINFYQKIKKFKEADSEREKTKQIANSLIKKITR